MTAVSNEAFWFKILPLGKPNRHNDYYQHQLVFFPHAWMVMDASIRGWIEMDMCCNAPVSIVSDIRNSHRQSFYDTFSLTHSLFVSFFCRFSTNKKHRIINISQIQEIMRTINNQSSCYVYFYRNIISNKDARHAERNRNFYEISWKNVILNKCWKNLSKRILQILTQKTRTHRASFSWLHI